ncbi:MAG: hypothetical protein HKN15_00620 [Xanthomonadales bacterium]|nr:hypothetical protein [Xanthomonadales bacterium]
MSQGQGISRSEVIFRAFKYTIYLLLAWNVFLFFREDLAASAQTFGDTVTWRNVVEAYSATIDTLAWVVLLLLFELETAVIDDERLKGGLKWLFTGIRAVCYFFITYAFYGYCVKYGLVSGLVPFTVSDACLMVGSEYTYIADLDEYMPITQASCGALQGGDLVRIDGTTIVGTIDAARAAINLSIVDIVNAGDWLIIVLLLEVEVYLQLKDKLTDRLMYLGKFIKGFFYLVLFGAAAYWGVKGDFLDFWDAFLWLVAFIFIELNVFQWHEETEEEKELQAVDPD